MADQAVRTSEVTWKEECEKHGLHDGDDPAYEFSSGARFKSGDGPYANDEEET